MKRSCLFTVFFLLALNASALAETSLPTYCVVGVRNHVKDRQWKDKGIGFGISNLISQYVYDSGLLTPVEEKEEIKASIQKHRELFWAFRGKSEDAGLQEKAEELGADYVFLGEVTACRQYRKKAFAGFVARYKTSVRVFFTLHLADKKKGVVLTANGEGFSEKGAGAVFFEAKDGKIDFNSTMVGIATENAVKDTVQKIMEKYQSVKEGGKNE